MQFKNGLPRIRSAEGPKGGLLLLLVTSAVWMSRISKVSAADSKDRPYLETTDHPLLETKDLNSETCVKCHAGKNQGKFVHTAVGMGCESCHQVVTGDNQTSIMLAATGGNLCAKCHAISKNAVQHGPYRAGECLICHDPHSGSYPAHTRAAANQLCLSCHGADQPEVRINAETKIVTLLDGRVYDLAAWQSAAKISARHGEDSLRSKPGSADSDKTTEGNRAVANCLSCHDPHSSLKPSLLRSSTDRHVAVEGLSFGQYAKFVPMFGVATMAPAHEPSFYGGRS
jgi:predicted CXXCH cytochrome family protein